MSNDISQDDIADHFKAWSREKPRRSPVPGFVDWVCGAPDAAQKTATELADGQESDLIGEIAYSMRQIHEERVTDDRVTKTVRPYQDAPEDTLKSAAQSFIDDYRAELIEALREVA